MQYPGLSVNAEHHSEISRSSDDCQSLCLSTPTCVAFQITSENLDCWIQNDWTKLMPDQARYADELSSEHVVVRKCSKGMAVCYCANSSGSYIAPRAFQAAMQECKFKLRITCLNRSNNIISFVV